MVAVKVDLVVAKEEVFETMMKRSGEFSLVGETEMVES